MDTLLGLWIGRLASKFYSSDWYVLHLGVRFKFGNALKRPAGLTLYIQFAIYHYSCGGGGGEGDVTRVERVDRVKEVGEHPCSQHDAGPKISSPLNSHEKGGLMSIFAIVYFVVSSWGQILERIGKKSPLLFTVTSSNGFYSPFPLEQKWFDPLNTVQYTETSSLRTLKSLPRNLNKIVMNSTSG